MSIDPSRQWMPFGADTLVIPITHIPPEMLGRRRRARNFPALQDELDEQASREKAEQDQKFARALDAAFPPIPVPWQTEGQTEPWRYEPSSQAMRERFAALLSWVDSLPRDGTTPSRTARQARQTCTSSSPVRPCALRRSDRNGRQPPPEMSRLT